MYGLLYKELILNKKQLFGITAVIVLFSAILLLPTDEDIVFSGEVFLITSLLIIVCMYLIVGMMQQGIFEVDEIKRWQYFITASPQMAKGHIRAKYVFVFLTSMIFTTYCIYLHTFSVAIHNSDYMINSIVFIEIMSVQLLIRSIEMPFIFRFGSKYGNSFRMVLVFIIAFAVIVYFLFGDISMFGTFEGFITRLSNFLHEDLLSSNKLAKGIITLCKLKTLITLAIYYLSYKLSCKLYLKGGEYYDK